MNRKDNNSDNKRRKDSSKKRGGIQSSKHDEDFNTGSHSPSSLRNVGAGYDDTGMGNSAQASGRTKIVQGPQKKLKGNTQKMRKVVNYSRKSR